MCRRNGRNLPILDVLLAVSIAFVLMVSAQADDAESLRGEGQNGEPDIPSQGPLVRWHPASGQMLQPNSEQTAALVEAFRQQMEARFRDGKGVLAPSASVASEQLEPERLENGMLRMRLPAHLINFTIVGKSTQGQAIDVLPEK